MITQQKASKISAIKIALAAIPAILILSICIALYLGASEEQPPNKPVEGEITRPELVDYLQKLNVVIGERGFGSPAGIKGLQQSSAMIQGTLGPENLGYAISKQRNDSVEGLLWETLWIDSAASDGKQPPVVVAVPYGENGTPLAFALGFAEYLTGNPAKGPVRLVFYPPLPSDDELRSWIEARLDDGKAIAGFIVIKGGGPELKWAGVTPSRNHREMVSAILSKKGWEGNLVLDEVDGPETTFYLGEARGSSRDDQARRLISMMPLVKAMIDRLLE